MKHLLSVIFVIFSLAAEAQFMNRRQRVVDRNPVATQPTKLPEFNIERAIGLTIYDVDQVLKKINVKPSSENYKKVITILNKFNREQRELSRIHGFSFSQAKQKVENAQKEVLKSRNYSILQAVYKEIGENFAPISDMIKEKEKSLDDSLKNVLSDKEFKKWKKLKVKIKQRK